MPAVVDELAGAAADGAVWFEGQRGIKILQVAVVADRMAHLFLDVLFRYREQGKYELHEFVVMPDHFHLLLTPNESVEKAVQFIKGGFSYRAKKELNFCGEIGGAGFHDRRVRDWEEYSEFRKYIQMTPVRARLCEAPELYPYRSAGNRFVLDDCLSQASEILPLTSGVKAP